MFSWETPVVSECSSPAEAAQDQHVATPTASDAASTDSERACWEAMFASPAVSDFSLNDECLYDLDPNHQLDGGCTITMTSDASLLRDLKPTNSRVFLADGSEAKGPIRLGRLHAQSASKPLPDVPALHVPSLSGTLISEPQLVLDGAFDYVHTKKEVFMQPHTGSCPVCVPHSDRIYLRDHASRILFPKLAPRSAACHNLSFGPVSRSRFFAHKPPNKSRERTGSAACR